MSSDDRPSGKRTDDPDPLEDDDMGEIIDNVDEDDAFDMLRIRLPLAALLASDFFPRVEPEVLLRSHGELLLDDELALFMLVSILSRFEYIVINGGVKESL